MRDRSSQLLQTIFSTDNAFMRLCEKILDLVTVNLLFLISCLPLVTIGIAKISFYRTLFAIREEGRVRVLRLYLTTFRENWRQGLLLGGLELGVLLLCGLNLLLLREQETLPFQLVKLVAFAILFLMTMVLLYAYPLASKYQQSLADLLKNSLLLAGVNLAWTFAFLALVAVLIFLFLANAWTLVFGSMFFLLVGFASIGLVQVSILEGIFTKYE